MKVEIRPFRAKHIHHIVPREYEREVSRATGRDWSHEFAKGQGFTLIADGCPRGAGGIVPIWAGVGEVWLYTSAWIYQHPKTTYYWVRTLLQTLIEQGHYYRVQCPILDTAPVNKRFVRHLGFVSEGRMDRWGPDGKAYCLYALVADEGETLCLRQFS